MRDETDQLPEGWALTTPNEFCESWGGATPSTSNAAFWGEGIPWVSSKDVKSAFIDGATEQITEAALKGTRLRVCPVGSVLVVIRSGVLIHTLPVAITRLPVVINQDLKAFAPRLSELGQWLSLALRAQSRQILEANRKDGTTVQSIRFDELKAMKIPLPPLAEQRRIVAKVEAVLARVNAARQRLAKVPALLKRFRQSVLAAACSGRLTADWREARNGIDEIVSHEEGIECPAHWTVKLTRELVAPGTVITYGIVLPGPNQVEGVPYIRGQDINDAGQIQTDLLWRTTSAIAAKHTRAELREGDVLLCVIRNLRVAIVPAGLDGANLTQGTVRMRAGQGIVNRYLAIWLNGPHAQQWMKSKYVGSDMPRINVEHARTIPVPVAPLTEQREIVRRVEALFALAEKIEARVVAASARADKLIQSTLAKAFRGELVPTEHALAEAAGDSYESAAQLLENACSQRPDASSNGTKRQKPLTTARAKLG
jgi:type I restriction enzyme, S subunit